MSRREKRKKEIVDTKGYVSRERKKDERNRGRRGVQDSMGGRSDKWRKGGPGHVNRGQEGRRGRSDASSCMDAGPFELTRHKNGPPNPFSSVIRDWASCKNRRPPWPMITVCVPPLPSGKDTSMRGTNLFYTSQILADHFFTNPFFHSRTSVGTPPFSRNCRLLVFPPSPSSSLLPLSHSFSRARFGVKGDARHFFFLKERIFLRDVVQDILLEFRKFYTIFVD